MNEMVTIDVPQAWLVERPPDQFSRLIGSFTHQNQQTAALKLICAAYQCDLEDAKRYLQHIVES